MSNGVALDGKKLRLGRFGFKLILASVVVACGCSQPTAPTGLRVDSPGGPDNSMTSRALSEVATSPRESGATPAGEFQLTKVDNNPSLGAPPEGMAWIPGGEFSMGANEPLDKDDVSMKAPTCRDQCCPY
jgi:hypothetical protein